MIGKSKSLANTILFWIVRNEIFSVLQRVEYWAVLILLCMSLDPMIKVCACESVHVSLSTQAARLCITPLRTME